MASVNIFNSSPEEIILEINAGTPLHVPPTGDTSNWIAQQPEDMVAWTERDQTVGGLHYGLNKIHMYRSGQNRAGSQEAIFTIDTKGEQVTALQFYLFWHSGKDLAWIVLLEGRPIALSPNMGPDMISTYLGL